MKKLFLLSIFLSAYAFAQAQQSGKEKEIEFNFYSWDFILATAKVQHKIIFLDAYASWCGPCKWVAAKVFTNPEVADYYNKTFINVSMDMEKGEGIALAKKYGIEAYPTFLYIDGNGNIMYKSEGIPSKKTFAFDFIQYGKNAVENQQKIISERNGNK